MADVRIEPATGVQGQLLLPGDKSISHRALLLAALGTRQVRITNLGLSADVRSTARAIEQLGAVVALSQDGDDTLAVVTGVGMRGLDPGGAPIDAGNAGTLARLLSGLLAGQPRATTIKGDASLSTRPMTRIITPLSEMGVEIDAADGGRLPLTIHGRERTSAIEYSLGVASAQVQSCILLAGLYADGPTTVHEPGMLRDHTERMLRRAGVTVERAGSAVTVHPPDAVELPDTHVPADPSSAAFFLAAGTFLPNSMLRIPGVRANPGRTGFVDHLEKMGARIGVTGRATVDGEMVADYEVQHAQLRRARLEWHDVPRMIDELPILGLAAQFCQGETFIKGAEELRVKESDRIRTIVLALRAIGVAIDELRDGFIVRGSGTRPDGGTIDSEGDHRIAMLGGIAGLVSRHGVTVTGAECADVSFPGYFEVLERLAVRS
jgi:3-phosphoshikimate 1-carboxyvinyltransferase